MSIHSFRCDKCGDVLILMGAIDNDEMLLGTLGGYTPHLAAVSPPPGLPAWMCDGQYQPNHELHHKARGRETALTLGS